MTHISGTKTVRLYGGQKTYLPPPPPPPQISHFGKVLHKRCDQEPKVYWAPEVLCVDGKRLQKGNIKNKMWGCFSAARTGTLGSSLRTSDRAQLSPSSRAINLSAQPRKHRRGLGTNLWMSLNDPPRDPIRTQSNMPIDEWQCSVRWQSPSSLKGSGQKNGRISMFIESHPRRLEAGVFFYLFFLPNMLHPHAK